MRKSIFSYKSYKQIMVDLLTGSENRGQLTKAAQEINCQRSYLSRVILNELHLTQEHAFKLAVFLKFSESERQFFQNLLELERSADPAYKAHLSRQIKKARDENETVQVRTNRTQLSVDSLQVDYFSSWAITAIHFLTSVPQFQTAEAMAKRLELKQDLVEKHLHFLAEAQFVEKKGNRWVYKTGEFHLPKESPLVNFHHQNWRTRSVLDSQDKANESIHFTGIFTLSEADFQRLRELVFQFISNANLIAGPSNPEDAVAITCDVFKV